MQVFASKENLGKITKTGNTTVQLSASTITLGAKQHSTGNLVCDTALSGAGGIDSGSIAANSVYSVYFVYASGVSSLVASLSDSSPTGFSSYKHMGYFSTNPSAQVGFANTNGDPIDERLEKVVSETDGDGNTISSGSNVWLTVGGTQLVITKGVWEIGYEAMTQSVRVSAAVGYQIGLHDGSDFVEGTISYGTSSDLVNGTAETNTNAKTARYVATSAKTLEIQVNCSVVGAAGQVRVLRRNNDYKTNVTEQGGEPKVWARRISY